MPSNVFNKDEEATAFKLEMSRCSSDITRVRIKHHTPYSNVPDSQIYLIPDQLRELGASCLSEERKMGGKEFHL